MAERLATGWIQMSKTWELAAGAWGFLITEQQVIQAKWHASSKIMLIMVTGSTVCFFFLERFYPSKQEVLFSMAAHQKHLFFKAMQQMPPE